MKTIVTFLCLICTVFAFGQIDKDQLALDVSDAEAANTEALKAYIWKRYSTATVSGEVKATMVTEFSFDENGELQTTVVGGESNVKKKPGIRGKVQENQMEESSEYISKALELSLAYTYMSKGQLLDFFNKATITEADGKITATGTSVYVEGDTLTVVLDAKTLLYISKVFSSKMGADPVSGEINYKTFDSGINHGATTKINLPAKSATIDAENKNYTVRVQ